MVAAVKDEIINGEIMEKNNENINENDSTKIENENTDNIKLEKKENSQNEELNNDKMEIDQDNINDIKHENDKDSIQLSSDEEDETKVLEENNIETNGNDEIKSENEIKNDEIKNENEIENDEIKNENEIENVENSEDNNIKIENNNMNQNDNDAVDNKMEENKNQDTTNNNIDNKTSPIEKIENNRIDEKEVKSEITNETDVSKENEISNNQNNISSPDVQKRQMSKFESSVCQIIIKSMERQPNAIPFLKPVDPVALNIPDYFIVIKHPMDFSTILKKLRKGQYPYLNDFVDDVDLVFTNCMTYNPPNNPVHKMGQEMKDFFIEQLKKYPDQFSDILLNKFNIDLSTIENSERRPRRQVRPPQHFEPEDELLMKRIKQQQRRSLMEQNEMKAAAYASKMEDSKMTMEPYDDEMNVEVKPTKASKATVKARKTRKSSKKPAKASKTTTKKKTKKRSYREMEEMEGEEMEEEMEDSDESSTDSEDELVESQITALTACLQQVQQQLEILQAQSNMNRHARKKSRRSISSFSEYYSNSEKETPISSKTLAAAHRRISSTSNTLPNPAPTRGRKKQTNIRKTAITNSALQTTGTRKRSKTKSETGSPAKRSPANSQGKVCEYCGGSETPMWRRGPSGKGSLCNKCGVKWKSGKIFKGEPIPSQMNSANNSVASSAVSTPNINPPPKTKRQKTEAAPKKPKVQSITYAQKKELSEMIGNLDEENLNGVIDIIRSGIPDLKDGQEEIELDIEAIDPVTLRKLYRYVKKVSKPVKVVQKPINQELQNYSDYSSGNESSDSGDESNDGE